MEGRKKKERKREKEKERTDKAVCMFKECKGRDKNSTGEKGNFCSLKPSTKCQAVRIKSGERSGETETLAENSRRLEYDNGYYLRERTSKNYKMRRKFI